MALGPLGYDDIPRFSGEEHWRKLSPEQQARIGAAALELAATACGMMWDVLLETVEESIELRTMYSYDAPRGYPLPSLLAENDGDCRKCVEDACNECHRHPDDRICLARNGRN